jgi:hypothetical protein
MRRDPRTGMTSGAEEVSPTTSPIPMSAPKCSRIEIAVSDDDLESNQFPSHQFRIAIVLRQDSVTSTINVSSGSWKRTRIDIASGTSLP